MDRELILKKWEPVLLHLNEKTPKWKLQNLAEYAELHMNKEADQNNSSDNTPSLLPISLRILDKINFNENQLIISDDVDSQMISGKLKYEDLHFLDGITIVDVLEKSLIEQTVTNIEKELKENNKFCIGVPLVSSIMTIAEKTMAPTIGMKTNYSIK